MKSKPTVCILCVTSNRRRMLPRAIESFQLQTYPNRKMLILSDGEDVSDLVPDDPRISLCDLACSPRTLGGKRNIGCSLIEADIIAHMDDDDWSSADRLTEQVALLSDSGRSVTGYRTMLLTDGAEWWRYEGSAAGWALYGASLTYRRDWWEANPFAAAQSGEDFLFANTADMAHAVVLSEGRDMMVAAIHPGNTSLKATSMPIYKPVPAAEAPQWFFERVAS